MYCFWKQDHPFSNWYKCPLLIDDQKFSCVEQYMMWRKACLFGDLTTAASILSVDHPYDMRALGRKVKGFQEATWVLHRCVIVEKALRAKFKDEKLRHLLLSTKDQVIAETAAWDSVWGTGANEVDTLRGRGYGQNLLGKLLMKVRDSL